MEDMDLTIIPKTRTLAVNPDEPAVEPIKPAISRRSKTIRSLSFA
jgi:hypothetical protein